MKKDELLSKFENNPLDNIDNEKQLLLLFDNNYLKIPEVHFSKLFSFFKNIYSGKIKTRLVHFFLEHKVSIIPIICKKLKDIPKSSIYREVKNLEKLGFITPISKFKASPRGGKKPVVYGLHNYSKEDVLSANEEWNQMMKPFFQLSEVIAQMILDEYLEKRRTNEITMNEIIAMTKPESKGFHFFEVAKEVSRVLGGKGVKVWY